MLAAGSIFGSHKIIELLGSGAMGDVYKATDTRLDRVVALKVINDKFSQNPDYRAKLVQEAKAAAKIDSPYVVKVWEQSEVDGQSYISLEYIPGRTLREYMAGQDFDDNLNLARQIALGLRSAHLQGLIHRDLKPENIKVNEESQIKILDFGLAKSEYSDSVDQLGNIEGTLHYLSPEQLTGDSITALSDQFSFGVLLYELFTGIRPFEGEYPAAIIYSILHEEPSLPSDIFKEMPGWVDELVMKLLSKQPAERFENINAVIDFIDNSLRTKEVKKEYRLLKSRQAVTVIDLKNLSGDENWEYFCIGFTEDIINELSKRTDLIISAEPSTKYVRDVREVFKHCRSDFVILGSLMKWQDKIRLHLKIFSDNGKNLIFGKNYDSLHDKIFHSLAMAVQEAAEALEDATGHKAIEVEDIFRTDIAAYEYYLKGKNYYQTGKPDDMEIAEKMFTRALEIDPTLAYAHSGLSDVYASQYMAYYDRSRQKIEHAKDEALKAIEILPDIPEAHRSLGRYYMFAGDFSNAEAAFLKAIELNPKYAIGYRTLAWLKETEGDHENAIYWARMSLKYAPNDLETLLLLSLINMDLRKYTIAMATLQRILELAPDYGRAHYNLGTVYLKLGVLDLALDNMLMAVKYKGDPNANIHAGYIYLIKKEYDKALGMFNESIKVGYFPFIALYFCGFIGRQSGDESSAKVYFAKALEVAQGCESQDKDNPHIKAYCALALAADNQREKAVLFLAELEKLSQIDGEILYDIARGYALLGDVEKARRNLERALAEHAGPTEKEVSFDPHFAGMIL
jgi:serine/threonine protein kinase/Tfp pilus assembly protein PilF